MRGLVIIVATFVLGAGGYWAFGARMIAQHGQVLIAQAPQFEAAMGPVRGFPQRFDFTLTAPVLRDRGDAPVWRAEALSVSTPLLRPDLIEVSFPDQHEIFWSAMPHVVHSRGMTATLELRADAELASLSLGADTLRLDPPLLLAASEAVAISLRAVDGQGAAYRLDMDGADLRLTPELRRLIDPQDNEGDARGQIRLTGDVLFAAPLHLDAPVPVIEQITVAQAEFRWAGLVMGLEGTAIRASQDGMLDGAFTLTLPDWRPFHALLVGSGMLDPDAGRMSALFFAALAGGAGTSVSLPLDIRQSVVSLGPLGLVQLPAL